MCYGHVMKSVISTKTLLDQWPNVIRIIPFVNKDGITQLTHVVSFCNQSFRIFAEEIQEHENLVCE